ncbi:DUF1848 domain-containing protein [Fodinicurvata sp. EGI_FJ10296]|uniref:DUF1848 domain-containing protein n=1 Tax=Fodinicurvata sp. EGI_FJ10296 TaxID=3231908 RepID=UPI003455F61B
MIVSASYRTDIPAFYGPWFRQRLSEGYCMVPNPYGGRDYRVDLTPAGVDGFVFWTRNPAPFDAALDDVRRMERPFVVQMTITGYPRPLDRSVIAPDRAIALVRDLSDRFGRRAVVWRYDPVLISDLTPPTFHIDTVDRLASALAGSVDEVVLSMATIYKKTRTNLDRRAHLDGFAWRDPDLTEKQDLLARLGGIAALHGMTPTVCSQSDLVTGTLKSARCIDAVRLSDLAGRPLKAPVAGNRPGCLCARSRDIGVYDTCPHGCVYCYAVRNRDKAQANHAAHAPGAPSLRP